MTIVADFLLQPAAPGKGDRAGIRDQAGLQRPTPGAQDFSRILVQQRQSADIKPPAPPRVDREPVREQAASRTDTRQNNEPARPTGDRTAAGSGRPERAEGADAGVRQKDDVEGRHMQNATATGDGEGLEEEDTFETSNLLDPLLEQVAQKAGADSETEAADEEILAGEQVVGNLLSMIQGGPLQATGKHAGDAAEGTLQAVRMQGAGAQQSEMEDAGSELMLEGMEEEQPLTSQLAATTQVRREADGGLSGTANQGIKAASGAEARPDALMRSEAVQSAQSARQVSGQPLNMQQPGWSKELTDKVMWMSSQNLKSAEIKLNPAELGRLDIRVQVGQEHTQITFASAHAGVRDSLDGQMHRLREMLEQQGMHNVDVEVSDQSRQERREQFAGSGGSRVDAADTADEEMVAVSEVEQQEQGHAGLVSYYV